MLYDRIRNIRSDRIWEQSWQVYSAKFPDSLTTETQEDFALTILAFLVRFYDDAQVIIGEKRTQESVITRSMNWVQSYFQNSLTKDILQRAKTETAGFFGGIIALYTFFSNKPLLSTESKAECLEKAQRFCNYFRDENDFLEQAIQLSIYLSLRFGAIVKLLQRGKEGQEKLAEFFSCAVIAELLNSRSERTTVVLSLEKLLFRSIPDEKNPLYQHNQQEYFSTVTTAEHETIPLIDLVLSTPIEIVGLSQTYEPIREASVRRVETQYLLEQEENIASQYHKLRSSFPVLEALIKGTEADFNQYNQARNKHDLLLKMMVNFNSSCELFKGIPPEKNMTRLIEGYHHQLSKQAVALYGLIKEYAITDQTVLANENYTSFQSYFNWFEQKKNTSRTFSHSAGLVPPNGRLAIFKDVIVNPSDEEKFYVQTGTVAGGVTGGGLTSTLLYSGKVALGTKVACGAAIGAGVVGGSFVGGFVWAGIATHARLTRSEDRQRCEILLNKTETLQGENITLQGEMRKKDEKFMKFQTDNYESLLNKIQKIQQNRSTIDLGELKQKMDKIKELAQKEDWLLPHHQKLIFNELDKLTSSLATSSHFNPPKNEVSRQQVNTHSFFQFLPDETPEQLSIEEWTHSNAGLFC